MSCQPTEEERLDQYFYQLGRIIPEPPRNWGANAKECKYLKLLEEKAKAKDATEETW